MNQMNKKMKILIATDSYLPTVNGVVTSIVNLEKALLAEGHDVRILTLAQKKEAVRSASENVYFIPSMSAEAIYPDARVLRSFARSQVQEIVEWGPAIIHTQSEFSTFTVAHRIAKYLNIPLVHTYHTVYEDYTHYFSPSKRVGKKAVRKFSDFVLNKTDAVIAPTEKVRELLENYGVETPIYTIPTGIDLSSFQNYLSVKEKREMRKKWGVPEEGMVLLFLGRLAKEKNIEELIRFAQAASCPWTLVIAGDGPDRSRLEELAFSTGSREKIRFLGMVPHKEVREVYHLADLYVSGSTSETQGLTYIEAMASGLPPLCRKDDCLNDLVIPGENGFLYENEQEFIQDLHWLFKNPQDFEKMSKAAEKKAAEFSSKTFGEHVMALYRQTIREYDRERADESEQFYPF